MDWRGLGLLSGVVRYVGLDGVPVGASPIDHGLSLPCTLAPADHAFHVVQDRTSTGDMDWRGLGLLAGVVRYVGLEGVPAGSSPLDQGLGRPSSLTPADHAFHVINDETRTVDMDWRGLGLLEGVVRYVGLEGVPSGTNEGQRSAAQLSKPELKCKRYSTTILTICRLTCALSRGPRGKQSVSEIGDRRGRNRVSEVGDRSGEQAPPY